MVVFLKIYKNDCINKNVEGKIVFSFLSINFNIVLGAQKNHLNEMALLRFWLGNKKIYTKLFI